MFRELLEKFKAHCNKYPDLQLSGDNLIMLEAFVEFAEREAAQQSVESTVEGSECSCFGWGVDPNCVEHGDL